MTDPKTIFSVEIDMASTFWERAGAAARYARTVRAFPNADTAYLGDGNGECVRLWGRTLA